MNAPDEKTRTDNETPFQNYIRQLRSREKSLKVAACAFLAAQGRRSVPYLIEVLRDDTADDVTRGYASDILRRLGTAAVAPVRDLLLGQSSDSTKLFAAATLALIPTRESVEALLAGFGAGSQKVDAEIVTSFRKIGRIALELLIRHAAKAKTQEEHGRAIRAIALFAGDRGFAGAVALIQYLRVRARVQAVEAFGNPVGLPANTAGLLLEMLKQEKESRPLMATIAAIRRLHLAEAKELLQSIAGAKGKPALVRQAAQGALSVLSKE